MKDLRSESFDPQNSISETGASSWFRFGNVEEGKKLYVISILSVLIIILFATFYLMNSRYQHESESIIKENKAMANLLSSLIYEHQKAAISIIESGSQHTLFIDAVKRKDFNKALPHLQSLKKYHDEIDALFITDPSGILWANYPVDRTGFGNNLTHRDWYKGVSKNWKPYVSSVYRMIVLEKGLAVAVSVPVFDGNGKVIGILSSAQRTAVLFTFVKEKIKDFEKSITVLDQEGNVILSNDVPYTGEIAKYPVLQVMEKAIAGFTDNMEIVNAKEKGGTSYIAIAPIQGLGWSVIIGHGQENILKSLYGYFILSAVSGITVLCFITVSLSFFRRQYMFRKTKELQESEEKYRNLYYQSALGIFHSTLDGRFTDVNPALARMLGYDSPEEAVSLITSISEQIYAEPPKRNAVVAKALEAGGFITEENHYRRRDGTTWYGMLHLRIIFDKQGRPASYEGFVEDVTERRKAENDLRESTCKLNDARDMLIQSEKLAAIGTLAAGVTHEILNPLNIISLNLQVLTTTEAPPEKMKQMLDTCQAQVERIVKISKDLNQFARIEAQEIEFGSINNLIEQTFNLIVPKLRIKKVATDLQLRSDLPPIPLDKGRLGQVFLNLINNAIDAMETVEEKLLRVSTALVTSAEREVVQIVIADRGTGISEENRKKLFDPFFTTKAPGKGTGLGLSITYGIIQRHGGRIWTADNEWGGASFFIELPVRTPSETASALPQAKIVTLRG